MSPKPKEAAIDDVEYDVFARTCPSRQVLDHVGGRWGMLVLGALADGPARFNAIARRVDGVSQKMLSATLHALEHDGFVSREAQGYFPPAVKYSLTPLGTEVATKLVDLIGLLETRMPQILEAQNRHRPNKQ